MGTNRLFLRLGCCILFIICEQCGVSMQARRASSPASSLLTDILDDLDLHSDNRIRPGYGEKALEVHAFSFIRNIIEINEVQSTITLSLLLMQMWEDPRLAFSTSGGSNIDEILIDNPDFMSRFWNPDTFIVNEVRTHTCVSSAEQRNLAHQIIRLNSSGGVLKTSRLTITVSCPMRHQNYPFHGFHCDIELESFGYKTKDILYIWRNGSKSIDHSKIEPASLATKTSYSLISVDAHSQQSHLDTGGSYSKLIIRLVFQKLWLRHAITFFIPTMVLTTASLLTLWLLDCDRKRQNKSCASTAAGAGILTNFVIAGFIILLGSLEYSTTPILAQLPTLTPVDFQIGICLSTVFASVAYHGLSFCCKKTCCCCCSCSCSACGTGHSHKEPCRSSKEIEEEGRNKGSTKTTTQRTDEGSTYTKVTSYDSYDYDVTDDGNDDVGDERLQAAQPPNPRRNDQEDDDDDDYGIGMNTNNGQSQGVKKRMQRRKGASNRAAVKIWRIFIHFSKSITTLSFIIAELLLCINYILKY